MLIPTSQRKDRTVATITVGLDNINTETKKKFKCSICGGTVFAYWDTMHILLPVDTTALEDTDEWKDVGGITETECTHLIKNEFGYRVPCKTIYILLRGSYGVSSG